MQRISANAARADSGVRILCVTTVPDAVSIILIRHTQCEDTSLVGLRYYVYALTVKRIYSNLVVIPPLIHLPN